MGKKVNPLVIIKWIIGIDNAVKMILGLASVVLGLLLYTTAVYSALFNGINLFGAVMLTGGGVGTVMVGLVAMAAMIYSDKPLAIFYTIMMLLNSVLYIVAGGWSLEYHRDLEITVNDSLSSTMYSHSREVSYTAVWDHLQLTHNCCGIDSWQDWRGVLPKGVAPDSCCKEEYQGEGCGNSAIPLGKFHDQGCLMVVLEGEAVMHLVVGIASLCLAVFQMSIIVGCLSFVCLAKFNQ